VSPREPALLSILAKGRRHTSGFIFIAGVKENLPEARSEVQPRKILVSCELVENVCGMEKRKRVSFHARVQRAIVDCKAPGLGTIRTGAAKGDAAGRIREASSWEVQQYGCSWARLGTGTRIRRGQRE
jgi:hypothetical protein